jgi:hypothetical protein
MRLLGILLVIFGVVLLAYQGLTFIIPQGAGNIGVFTITVNENVVIPLPPVVGVVCLLCGAVMILSAPPREYY